MRREGIREYGNARIAVPYPSRTRVALKFSPVARTTYRRMRPSASWSSPAGSRSRRTVAPVRRRVVSADAAGPPGSTPGVGCRVSGVSTPVTRTVARRPSASRTLIVSPSITRSTWAGPVVCAAAAAPLSSTTRTAGAKRTAFTPSARRVVAHPMCYSLRRNRAQKRLLRRSVGRRRGSCGSPSRSRRRRPGT